MFLGLPDPHPDPLDRGTDPRIRICIRIHTKMSRIHNTLPRLNIKNTITLLLSGDGGGYGRGEDYEVVSHIGEAERRDPAGVMSTAELERLARHLAIN
jgi:hypothetical protein